MDELDDQSDHESEIPQFNLLLPPLEVATARLAAARLAGENIIVTALTMVTALTRPNFASCSHADSPVAQPNNAVAAVAGTYRPTAWLKRHRSLVAPSAYLAKLYAVAAATRKETEHLQEFLQDPKTPRLAVHSRAAPITRNKNKSQLNTSYSMLEVVLDSGKIPGYRKYSAESLRQRMSLARMLRGEHHVVQTAKNDMAPILVPDDLMDFNGRFALMWKVIDSHHKTAFKAGEPRLAPPCLDLPQSHYPFIYWQAMAAANGFAGPPSSLQPQPAPWPCIPQAAQRLHDFHAHEAAGKAL
ncbi:hypothetical protein V8C86DRAFT_3028602 [Haematococcus lacustris]